MHQFGLNLLNSKQKIVLKKNAGSKTELEE
jgi:hypothetical protein